MARSTKSAQPLRLGPQGRIVIPAPLRKRLRLVEGDTLVAWVEDDSIVLRRREQVEEELWRRFRGVKGRLVKELIAERRREARRESKD